MKDALFPEADDAYARALEELELAPRSSALNAF